MIIAKELCSGCHTCISICQKKCILMQSDSEGFWYPAKKDASNCTNCAECEKSCPVANTFEVQNVPIAYAAYNRDEQIRFESSSGGIFSLLAEWTIDNGGVVFAACFDSDFSVVHDFVEKKEQLQKMRGSKYVQSKIGDSYELAKGFLEAGRYVLFTGTPCQVGGLKAYLGKEYDNLVAQDLICHGVPSPKVWQKYVEYRVKHAGSKPEKVSFRHKKYGWKRFAMFFLFENGMESFHTLDQDLMLQAFLKNSCLRPSCHNCSYKTIHRQSDITLADFWGINNDLGYTDDDSGISLVFVNSDKGETTFNFIRHDLICEVTDLNTAIINNPTAVKSVLPNEKRAEFFSKLDDLEFDVLVKKYCAEEKTTKIKRFLDSLVYVVKTYGVVGVVKKLISRRKGNDIKKP